MSLNKVFKDELEINGTKILTMENGIGIVQFEDNKVMSADEMFEELGYKKLTKKELKEKYEKDKEYYEMVECYYEGPLYIFIVFYKDKTFDFVSSKTMQELKAINKKCEELGWL